MTTEATGSPTEALSHVQRGSWKPSGRGWSKWSIATYKTFWNYFQNVLGSKSINLIDAPVFRAIKATLAQKKTRPGMTISAKRVNLYLDFLKAVMGFAKDNSYTQNDNPVAGMNIRLHAKAVDRDAKMYQKSG